MRVAFVAGLVLLSGCATSSPAPARTTSPLDAGGLTGPDNLVPSTSTRRSARCPG